VLHALLPAEEKKAASERERGSERVSHGRQWRRGAIEATLVRRDETHLFAARYGGGPRGGLAADRV